MSTNPPRQPEPVFGLPRRAFTRSLCLLGLGAALPGAFAARPEAGASGGTSRPQGGEALRLFVCGDVMTGRGVDQILPTPGDPALYEGYVRDAREYVALAGRANGHIPRPVSFDYVWGDALRALADARVHARIVNLETAVTASGAPWPDKGIHYRMHPANLPALSALGVDVCVLANNHVLDWSVPGLLETLKTLRAADIGTAGAGEDRDRARRPAVLEVAGRRLLVFGFGLASSGIPDAWAAVKDSPGVNFLPDASSASLAVAAAIVRRHARPSDRVVVSIHWGGNWGYAVPDDHRVFARGLIEQAGVDIVHGHSSHHPLGIEIHRGRPIFYGCGDFLNDYEGIGGYERYRPDLVLAYLPELEPGSGTLRSLMLVPLQLRRMRLRFASGPDADWLADTLTRHSRGLGDGVRVEPAPSSGRDYPTLAVCWGGG